MKKNVLVLAVTAALTAAPAALYALDLSRGIEVKSKPGQPFKAVVGVVDIPDPLVFDELDVRNASPASYADSGLVYDDFIGTIRVSLSPRNGKNGSRSLIVTSTKAPKGNFTLLLDASWSAGRVQRDYAINLNAPSKAVNDVIARTQKVYTEGQEVVAKAGAKAETIETELKPEASATKGAATVITVQKGATAIGLANRYKPKSLNLDTYLAGILVSNPDAFINGNINKIKAGALVKMPDRALLSGIAKEQVKDILSGASTGNFNDYRAKLAANLGPAKTEGDTGTQAGKLAKGSDVKDQANVAADRLALTKPANDSALFEKQKLKEARERIAELEKQLSQIQSAKDAIKGPAPAEIAPSLQPSLALGAQVLAKSAGPSAQGAVVKPADEVGLTLKTAPQITNGVEATGSVGGAVEMANSKSGADLKDLPDPSKPAQPAPMVMPPAPEEVPEVPKTLVERLLNDPADVFVSAMSSIYGMGAAAVLGLGAIGGLVASSRRRKSDGDKFEPDAGDDADPGLVFQKDAEFTEPGLAGHEANTPPGSAQDDPMAFGAVDPLDDFDSAAVVDVDAREPLPKPGFFSRFKRPEGGSPGEVSKPSFMARFSR